MSDVQGLRAIEEELSAAPPTGNAPVVQAIRDVADAIGAVVNQRDHLIFETRAQQQSFAALEAEFAEYRAKSNAEIARLRAELDSVVEQRNWFRKEADGLRDGMAAVERISGRALGISRNGFAERAKLDAAISPKDDGKPAPSFLRRGPARPEELAGRPPRRIGLVVGKDAPPA